MKIEKNEKIWYFEDSDELYYLAVVHDIFIDESYIDYVVLVMTEVGIDGDTRQIPVVVRRPETYCVKDTKSNREWINRYNKKKNRLNKSLWKFQNKTSRENWKSDNE